MPNWPVDDGPDFDVDDDFGPRPPRRRNSIIRTPEQRAQKTWNGNSVKTMESDHIMNAILFCEKKFAEGKRNFAECYGEVSGFYFKNPADMFPEYMWLIEEWNLRLEKK